MLPTLDPVALISNENRLGRGVHRTGYSFGDFCIKVANSDNGMSANQAEVDGWQALQAAEADLRSHFCEVIAADPGGVWLIMPLCTQDNDAWRDVSWLEVNGICTDLHSGNVMRHPDGHIVITDYGFGVSTSGSGVSQDDDSDDGDGTVWFGTCPGVPTSVIRCVVGWDATGLLRCGACNWHFAEGVCSCAGCVAHRAAA